MDSGRLLFSVSPCHQVFVFLHLFCSACLHTAQHFPCLSLISRFRTFILCKFICKVIWTVLWTFEGGHFRTKGKVEVLPDTLTIEGINWLLKYKLNPLSNWGWRRNEKDPKLSSLAYILNFSFLWYLGVCFMLFNTAQGSSNYDWVPGRGVHFRVHVIHTEWFIVVFKVVSFIQILILYVYSVHAFLLP